MRLVLLGIVAAFACHYRATAAVPIVPDGFRAAQQPQVNVDEQGMVHIVFGQSNAVYYVGSTDNGCTFDTPERVGTLPKLALGMRRGPRVTSVDSTIIVSAISHQSGDVNVWVSNNGEDWINNGVNDAPAVAKEGLHAMAGDRRKRAFIVWLDSRHGGAEVWGVLSEDKGKTWTKNVCVYRSPDGHVCECCQPNVVFAPNGHVFVMWRNWLNGGRDMFLAESADGVHFGRANKLGTGSWSLKACPMDGGGIAMVDGTPMTIWRRHHSIFTATGEGNEKELGPGTQPIVVSFGDNLRFVWQQDNALVMRNGNRAGLSKILADNGRYPSAAAASSGKRAFVAWEVPGAERPIVGEWIE